MPRQAFRTFPSPTEVAALLSYDGEDGTLRWISPTGGMLPGDLAGTTGYAGYRLVVIAGWRVAAHRIAWAIQTGEWPPDDMDVDHKDRDKGNNRWANLRLASRSQNNMNQGRRSNNRSGSKGVCQRSDTGRWLAYISAHGKTVRLGSFATKAEAIAARRAAEPIYHEQFARSA